MTTLPHSPSPMKCVEILSPGGAEQLRLAERPRPIPHSAQVLIEVWAAGVNRPDLLQREGRYPPPAGASDLLGLEVAGQVVAAGPSSPVRPGTLVCALLAGGGYAEYCVADAELCLPAPANWTPTEAASLPETLFTVWTNVFEDGRLKHGERLLVHGGASGVGAAAIQLATARGARVLATAGSAEKCRFCESLGAELAIDYRGEDFVERVLAHTGGRGVDVALDMVGGDYLPRNVECLAPFGRLIQIAIQAGASGTLDLWAVMRKRLTITGSTLRPRPLDEKARIARALRAEVWPLFDRGAIRPVVSHTFPLAEAAEAHRLMERGEHLGKIVLVVREPS